MSSPNQNLSKKTRRYVENMNKKVVLFMTNMSFQPLWLIYLLEFYWFLNSNSQELIVGAFSYKAHFRPQISSNGAHMGDNTGVN